MDGMQSVLDAILDEENFEEFEDAEMVDVEEGELVEENLNAGNFELVEENLNGGDRELVKENLKAGDCELVDESLNDVDCERSVSVVTNPNEESGNRCQNKRRRKKKNKKNKRCGWGCPDGIDVNVFVINVCRFLRERKSYLVYSAVGCLGVSALNDLVKEVDAIQACGGQKIPDGSRLRTGGGILWNILKTRDPNVYKEIMKQGREFEKQFKHHSVKREPALPSAGQSSRLESDILEEPERPKAAENHNDEPVKLTGGEKRSSVHDRLRVPVSYSDLIEKENWDNERVHKGDDLHDGRLASSSPSAI